MKPDLLLHGPFLAALLFGWEPARAQLAEPVRRARSEPARSLERNYERIAQEALSRYFADKTFLVKAQVEMDAAGGGPIPDRVPQLPGIPYQPVVDPAQVSETIGAVFLDVLVDTAYTQRDRDFIQYLVVVASNLDTARGDLVRVSRAPFPRDDRALHRANPWRDPPPVHSDTVVRVDSAKAEPPGLARQTLEKVLSQLPLLLVCLSALAGLWIYRRPRLRHKGATPPAPGPAGSPGNPTPPPAPTPSVQASTPQSEIRSLRPFLVNCFIGDPRTSGQILKSWIEHDRSKGAHEAAILLSGLNPRLLETVRETLGEDGANLVEGQIAAGIEGGEEAFVACAREFRREFQVSTQRHGDRRQTDLFGFLEQLNEGQILHILKDEPPGIAGFVLAQVSAAKAATILQGLDSPARARYLQAIGSIGQIPLEVYKEIADRLSLRAMEVANMKFVSADGVDSLLKLIESLPVDQQFPYIHSLSEVDLNLAKKLRGRTVTLQEVPALSEKFLAARLQSIDPQVLAFVLPRYDATSRDRMFSMLPERMRQLVQSSLEGRKGASAQEIESACQKFLKSFRDEIRQNGRPT